MKTPPKKTKPKNRWGGSWTHLLHPPSTPSPPPPFTYHSLPLPLSSEREGGEKRVISKWGEKEGGGSVEGGSGGFGLSGASPSGRPPPPFFLYTQIPLYYQ